MCFPFFSFFNPCYRSAVRLEERGSHQQASESEATLLVGDRVLAVQAAVSLAHRLHHHVPLGVAAQRLHGSVAAEDAGGHNIIRAGSSRRSREFLPRRPFSKTKRLPTGQTQPNLQEATRGCDVTVHVRPTAWSDIVNLCNITKHC